MKCWVRERTGTWGLGMCWLGWLAACSGGDGNGSGSTPSASAGSGGAETSSSGSGSSSAAAGSAASNLPPVTRACQDVCDLHEQRCGAPCTNDCEIERLVYDEACDTQGLRFYECAKTSTQNCADDNTITATEGCRQQMTDYVTCYALKGAKCERAPALDEQCDGKAATPFSHRCVSDAVPADCVPALGAYYCCPSE
jgi:hypothetical protein